MLGGYPPNSGKNRFVESWQVLLYPGDPAAHRGDIGPLKEWERITRVDGAWMVILLMLCLIGPWLLVGRARSGMMLFAATALVLMFFPIFVAGYEYRYTIPAFAPLLAAGALAAWGLVVRLRPLVGRLRPKLPWCAVPGGCSCCGCRPGCARSPAGCPISANSRSAGARTAASVRCSTIARHAQPTR